MNPSNSETLELPVNGQPFPADDDPLFEEIDGHKVDTPPMSAYAVQLANNLTTKINLFAYPLGLGEAVVETLFALPAPVNRNRRPDGAFLSYARWPKNRRSPAVGNARPVVPDLALEVISPTDHFLEVKEKIREYFLVGVTLVWVVVPNTETIEVFSSPSSVRILAKNETLEGGAVLPGFQLPLKELFLEDE